MRHSGTLEKSLRIRGRNARASITRRSGFEQNEDGACFVSMWATADAMRPYSGQPGVDEAIASICPILQEQATAM